MGFATPIFIFALLMVWLFGFYLDLFPTGGSVQTPGLTPGTLEYILSKIYRFAAPRPFDGAYRDGRSGSMLRNEIVDMKH